MTFFCPPITILEQNCPFAALLYGCPTPTSRPWNLSLPTKLDITIHRGSQFGGRGSYPQDMHLRGLLRSLAPYRISGLGGRRTYLAFIDRSHPHPFPPPEEEGNQSVPPPSPGPALLIDRGGEGGG